MPCLTHEGHYLMPFCGTSPSFVRPEVGISVSGSRHDQNGIKQWICDDTKNASLPI